MDREQIYEAFDNGLIGLDDIIDISQKDGYNQALEDIMTKVKEHHYLLSDKINSTDYGMFTCGIEQVIDELKR